MEFSMIAMVISFGLSMLSYPKLISYLEANGSKQTVSEFALDAFKNKPKTPTFGGLIFVAIPILVAVVFNGLHIDSNLYLILFVYGSFGLIGFIDDYKIVKEGKNDGLSPKQKFLLQNILALGFYVLYILNGGTNILTIPFTTIHLDLGLFYLPLVMLMLVGASNAVNLTDGMDGLAGGTTLIALVPLIVIGWNSSSSLLIALFAILGSLIAFLWFNKKPAKIFMGDVGSLSLGAMMAACAVIYKSELVFVVIAGVFVFETVCVIIQKISWKTRKKRVFRYTPIHYTFTLNGWEESNVVKFFYAIGLVCMVVSLVLIALS